MASARTYGIALITLVPLDTSRQAKANSGFAAHDFTIDWDNEQVTCPAGKTSATWSPNVQDSTPQDRRLFRRSGLRPLPVQGTVHHPQPPPARHPRPDHGHPRGPSRTANRNLDQGLRSACRCGGRHAPGHQHHRSGPGPATEDWPKLIRTTRPP